MSASETEPFLDPPLDDLEIEQAVENEEEAIEDFDYVLIVRNPFISYTTESIYLEHYTHKEVEEKFLAIFRCCPEEPSDADEEGDYTTLTARYTLKQSRTRIQLP